MNQNLQTFITKTNVYGNRTWLAVNYDTCEFTGYGCCPTEYGEVFKNYKVKDMREKQEALFERGFKKIDTIEFWNRNH